MRVLRRLAAVALFVGVLVVGWRFAARNDFPISVYYFVGEAAEVSLWLALLIAFALGAVLSASLMLYEVARLGLLARRRRREVDRLEAEVHELRNLPLDSQPPAALFDDEVQARAAEEAVGRSA